MLDTRNFVVPNVNGYVCVDDGDVCAYVTNDVRSEKFAIRGLIVGNRHDVINCNGTQYDKFAVREALKSYVSVRRCALCKTLVLNP